MKGIAIVLVATAAICAGGPQKPREAQWNAFKVTYASSGKPGFFDLPWTVSEATADGRWKKIDEDKETHTNVYSQNNDPSVMLLMDNRGNICGMRMAIIKEQMDKKAKAAGIPFTVDYENNSYFKKANYFGKDLYYSQVLFQNPTTLASGGRRPINKGKDNVAEGIFFKNDGKWTEVSRNECQIDKNIFQQANCYPGMGAHYPVKNVNDSDCNVRKQFISLYNEGSLCGFVFSGHGDFECNANTQCYKEDFPVGAIKAIMPNAPACMEDYVRKFGLNNMHVYFTKNAANISCPNPRWSSKC